MKKIFLIIWIGLVMGGLWSLENFSGSAGKSTRAPASLPLESRLVSKSGKPLFLVFIHPKCSCSHATYIELKKLKPYLQGVEVKVIFNLFDQQSTDWSKTDLWEKFSSLPDVEMVIDSKSRETKIYQVTTSGHAFLYDEKLRLVFSGGLTPSRGHEGQTNGQIFVKSWLKNRSSQSFIEKVFGCDFFGIQS